MIRRFFTSSLLRTLIIILFISPFFSGKKVVALVTSKKKFSVSSYADSLKNNNHTRDKYKKVYPINQFHLTKCSSTEQLIKHQGHSFVFFSIDSFRHLPLSEKPEPKVSKFTYVNISFLKDLRTIRMLC